MNTRVWFLVLVLGAAACGGDAADSTIDAGVEASGNELSGLSLDVHQAPG